MNRAWTLKRKGFVFIVMPLVLQVMFVLLLAVFLYQEQNLALKEVRAKKTVLFALRINKEISRIITMGIIYESSKGAFGEKLSEESLKSVSEIVDQLEGMVDSGPRRVSSIKRRLSDYFELLRDSEESLSKQGFTDEKILEGMAETIAFVGGVVDEESRRLDTGISAKISNRFNVRICLFSALTGNLLLLVLLPLSFERSIIGRLRLLSEKTRKLSERQYLGEPDGGDDEIARLDKFLHRADQEIAQALEREKSTVRNSADAIIATDIQGAVTAGNRATTRITGYSEEELSELTIFDLSHADGILALRDRVAALLGGEDVRAFESTIMRKDGDEVEALWSIYQSPQDHSLFVVLHDLTEEKEVERIKEEFVASISHDLRTPLTSLENAISLVLLGVLGSVPEQAEEELRSAQRNANRLIKLINDLLDFEKLKAGRMSIDLEPVALPDMVAESLEMVSGDLEKNGVEIDTEDISFTMLADRDRLSQVLVNLLSNAIKYSPQGGRVRLSARQVDRDLQILVADNGPGVPENLQNKIFEAYEQVDTARDSAKKGAGLGLAIAASIVREHGGSIGVFSQEGYGSTFWFTLPLATKGQPH